MTSSIYTSYIDHNMHEILARARRARADGQVLEWGHLGHTVEQAAADMGARVHCDTDEGLLCELLDRLYVIVENDGGPWAVEVATQGDLADDVSDADIRDLSTAAAEAGDLAQCDLCDAALDGDAVARAECVRVIREGIAQREDDALAQAQSEDYEASPW